LENNVDNQLFKIYSNYEKKQLINLLNKYIDLKKEMNHYQHMYVEMQIFFMFTISYCENSVLTDSPKK